jgi:hypothetical protein
VSIDVTQSCSLKHAHVAETDVVLELGQLERERRAMVLIDSLLREEEEEDAV